MTLWREYKIWYLELALRHLNPTHVDVPGIVIELHRLKGLRPKGW